MKKISLYFKKTFGNFFVKTITYEIRALEKTIQSLQDKNLSK